MHFLDSAKQIELGELAPAALWQNDINQQPQRFEREPQFLRD
jgi:hypothetical protein